MKFNRKVINSDKFCISDFFPLEKISHRLFTYSPVEKKFKYYKSDRLEYIVHLFASGIKVVSFLVNGDWGWLQDVVLM